MRKYGMKDILYTNKIEVNFDDPYITWPLWPRDQGEIVAKTFLHYP